MTKATLRSLFDLQRFDGNARLQKVIDEVHRRAEARELTDDELGKVAAAGVQEPPKPVKPGDLPI